MALEKEGFTRKTYSDLEEELEIKFKELFGADINLASYTPLGIIMRVMAFFYATIWDTIEKVYNARFIKKSDGSTLDLHGSDKQVLRNPATNAYVDLTFVGSPGFVVQSETIVRTEGDIQFATLEDVTIGNDGTAVVNAISVETGTYNNVQADTVTILLEADDNIESVINLLKAEGGTDTESDANYQSRLIRLNESNGKSTMSAVETALNNVVGVRSANVVPNKTMEVDVHGNPPKSLHAYVLGGVAEDIADALFNSISATTETVGSREVEIFDDSKNAHIIKFDYAAEKNIFIKMIVTKNSSFETDGETQLKDACVSVIGGITSELTDEPGLGMGDSVIVSKLYSAAYKVSGIEDVEITVGLSAENQQMNNIEIAQNEVAFTSIDNIEVVYSA